MQDIKTKGLLINLFNQPINSPDLNVLVLGIFATIQALYYAHPPKNFKDLQEQALKAYDKLTAEKINAVFLTYQAAMNEIVECDGFNNYQMPRKPKHLGPDDILQRADVIEVSPAILDLSNTDT